MQEDVSQQISRRPPANQALRPFYHVFVDWFDLDEGWDGYQGDGAIVHRVITVVYEATGIAITYFTIGNHKTRNLAWAAFIANPVGLPVKNADLAKSEGVDC